MNDFKKLVLIVVGVILSIFLLVTFIVVARKNKSKFPESSPYRPHSHEAKQINNMGKTSNPSY